MLLAAIHRDPLEVAHPGDPGVERRVIDQPGDLVHRPHLLELVALGKRQPDLRRDLVDLESDPLSGVRSRGAGRSPSALATRGVERDTAPAGLRVEASRDAIVAQTVDQPFGEREVHPAYELAMVLD